ncbi:type II toxin-antitoxin system prevent-host-death family antitoxin [Streptomyces sp. NPDC020731]|uniref:type II toxin-antitoxin system prevent-host-death family antitoxin n=1 Tax=Streptomyces sp. NPDC020731 TaxID=3365085 RepID=UPI0037B488B7
MTEMTIGEAAARLDELVRRLAGSNEPVVITDGSGATALLVAPRVIKGMEDALAVADHRRRQAEGPL